MAKIVPTEIADYILPFNWDVRLVWEQEAKVLPAKLADFEYLLNLQLWSSVPNRGMLFDISPREVIASPKRAPHQERRILEADIRFPIDFLCYRERLWILDGVHRLARLFLMGADSVSIRVHSETIIPRITVRAKRGGGGNSASLLASPQIVSQYSVSPSSDVVLSGASCGSALAVKTNQPECLTAAVD